MQAGKDDSKTLGKDGEDLAASYLRGRGYRILDRNYRCRLGEVDLVLERKGRIVFAEVKTRRSVEAVSPRELISPSKQRHISRVAHHYLASKRFANADAAFGVLMIDWSAGGPRVEWIEDAFLLAWGY